MQRGGEGQENKRGYAFLNKIIQQVAEAETGMSKGRGEDKR